MAFLIQLASLLLIAGYAIRDAESTRWRWINVGAIVGSILAGIAVALLAGVILHDPEFGPSLGLTFSTLFGFLGSACVIGGNKWRSGGIRKGQKVRAASNDKTVI
jgi:hypothetical protein